MFEEKSTARAEGFLRRSAWPNLISRRLATLSPPIIALSKYSSEPCNTTYQDVQKIDL